MTYVSLSDWARLSKESGKGDPDPTFPLLFRLNPASLLLSSLSQISVSFPICINPHTNFGKCCFLGSSQILHPVNVFQNTSLFVGQIPDLVNTLSDPISKLFCTLNLKPPLSQPLRKALYSGKSLNCSYNQWQNNYCWDIVLKWGNFREQNNPHPSPSHPFKVGVFAVFCR